MNILMGQSDLDIYLPENKIFPGGGALNMSYHWRKLGVPFTVVTRIANDRSHYFLDFYKRHGVRLMPASLIKDGQAGSSDILILPNGEPFMDNWIEGIGADLDLDAAEVSVLEEANWVHAFLIDAIVGEIKRLTDLGLLTTTMVSGDFFDFEPYNLVTFRETMRYIDIGFLGWQKDLTDEMMVGIREVVRELKKMLVVTLGSRGVMVYDGRHEGNGEPDLAEHFFAVEPVPVTGTTVGCGDAFAAYFLAEWLKTQDISMAVNAGKVGGAQATQWRRCLPNSAYGFEPL